jgi:hypothetical protein
MACFGSMVLSILSRWLTQFCLYLDPMSCNPDIISSFLMTSLHILSSLVYPLTLLRKCNSAASRQVITLTLHDYNFGLNVVATECVRRMW